jgi:hypothetical protein
MNTAITPSLVVSRTTQMAPTAITTLLNRESRQYIAKFERLPAAKG